MSVMWIVVADKFPCEFSLGGFRCAPPPPAVSLRKYTGLCDSHLIIQNLETILARDGGTQQRVKSAGPESAGVLVQFEEDADGAGNNHSCVTPVSQFSSGRYGGRRQRACQKPNAQGTLFYSGPALFVMD